MSVNFGNTSVTRERKRLQRIVQEVIKANPEQK